MKTKYLFLAALAGMTLVGCTSDDFIAEAPPVDNNEAMTPIVFSSLKSNFTRDDFTGAEAAKKLGNQFVVFGYKGTKTGTPGVTVFDNYLVKYAENTANTTESNSSNWEYVLNEAGVPIKHAKANGIVAQTIKYWDYSQPQYDFFAWSAGSKTPVYEGNPAAGQVLVSKMAATPETTTTDGVDKTSLVEAYTFTGKADDLSQVFISDLVTVKKDGSTAGKYGETVGYRDHPVTLRFRQLGTKVRIGIYETIPGYSVRGVKFYTTGDVLEKDPTDPTKLKNGQIVGDATLFSAGADIYKEGTYTVSFPTVDTPDDADNNQAHIAFAPKSGAAQATVVDWGALNYTIAEKGEKTTGNVYLGRTSNTATFAGDADANYYVVYLPNSTGANLNLRVDFTMESIDGGGEVIEVKNAKAQVPSIYTQWKPGFAYTYLFKISDKTNGRTGVYDPTKADDATVNSDPAGLYPITFDALVVNDEDNDKTQETITTVMTPSITTYQQNSTVVNNDEYSVNDNDIFVTVNEGDNLVTLTGKAALYTIPAGKTEAEVVDALSIKAATTEATYARATVANEEAFNAGQYFTQSGSNYTLATTYDANATYYTKTAEATITGRNKLVLTEADCSLTNSVEFGVDGNAITVATDQALRFTPAAATTYAFVYTKTASTSTEDKYQPVTKAAGVDVEGLYRFDYKASTGDAQKGVTYFSKDNSNGYTMVPEPFIGQGVGNLYLDANGTEIASGYAKTGTAYFYTVDHGMTYTEAHNVTWGENCLRGLYEKIGNTYEATQDRLPQDNKAYYYHDTTNNVYIYCVFTPENTDSWYVLNERADKVLCVADETAIDGQTYFDKYTKNNGEYYAKVIKVE